METINIKIAADATVSYTVSGVKGAGCKNLTKAIDALSGKVLESKNTAEYFMAPQQQNINQGH